MGDFGCWDIRGKFVITVDHDTVADKTEHKVKGGQVKETFKRWGDMKVKPQLESKALTEAETEEKIKAWVLRKTGRGQEGEAAAEAAL